jgi:hypothetical protein
MNLLPHDLVNEIGQGLHGPGKFRFIIQPLIAIVMGYRDGRSDAHFGKPPYFVHLLTATGERSQIIKSAMSSIMKPLLLAWLMDTLFQLLVLGRWNPFQALIVGFLLVALPYIIFRSTVNRFSLRDREHV